MLASQVIFSRITLELHVKWLASAHVAASRFNYDDAIMLPWGIGKSANRL